MAQRNRQEQGPAEPPADPPAEPPGESASALAAFRSREFTTFWVAGLVSNTGTWMQTVTVPFVIDQLTHSTALVGVSVFCTFFPATVVGPLAGSLSDRQDRRSLLIWAQALAMAMAAALWLLWATGTATTLSILACVIVSGLSAGMTTAAWQSFVPQLVPRNALLSAVRVNSMQFTGARAFGPALAGLVLATLGPSYAFAFNALSFLVVIGALLTIHPRPFAATEHHGSVLRHFREGLRYVRARAVLVVSVLMVMLIALFGVAMVQLVEPFSRHVLGVGAGVYGLLTGAYGTGAIIGSLVMVWFGDALRRSRVAAVGLLAMAVGDLVLGLAPVWVVGLGALFVMGGAQVFCMVACNTAIQLNVDEGFRGRASSLFTMSFFAAAPIGALIGGVVGEWAGLRVTMVGSAVALALLTLWALVRFRGLRPLDRAPRIDHVITMDAPPGGSVAAPLPSDLDTAGHLVVEPVD